MRLHGRQVHPQSRLAARYSLPPPLLLRRPGAAWTSLQDLPLGNIPEVSPGQGVVGRFVGLHPSLEALLNSPLESGRHVERCSVTVSRCLAKRFCGCHSGF